MPSRLIAKKYLFRQIYRGSGYAYANDPEFMHVSKDPKFWDQIGERFWEKYSYIDRTHKMWADRVMRGQTLVGPLGREWVVPMKTSWRGEVQVPWTTLSNYPVQGTGADVMMIARISLHRRIKAAQIPAIPILTVHDSIVYDTPDEHVDQVVNLFHQVFDDLIPNIKKLFGYEWVVPLECETKIGPRISEMKEVLRTDK